MASLLVAGCGPLVQSEMVLKDEVRIRIRVRVGGRGRAG